jgi:hypothetical protein
MIDHLRKQFNSNFTENHYILFLNTLEQNCGIKPGFRVAETPIFLNKSFKDKMFITCENIIDFITDDNFKKLTHRSIPNEFNVPDENEKPEMLVFDFGICKNSNNELEPQLIEMQGFPSVYGLQLMINDAMNSIYLLPENLSSFLNGYNKTTYIQLLKEIILSEVTVENVILLEIEPEKQKTKIDFYCLEKLLGIKTVCLKQIISEKNDLFYFNNDKKIKIERIFNRIIFDDLKNYDLSNCIDLKKSYNVEWCPHPNWFYRISKFTLPFLDDPYIPKTYFLNEITQPLNLDEYDLKPLFSYAGMGVKIDVKQEDIDTIADPENWILQQKVNYADVIETPNGNAKAEIRLFYFWKKEWKRPIAVHNLARLSKGKMIGTRYNENDNWVGGTIAFFEA